MADVYENDAAEIGTGARDQEIEKYNSTIHIEPVMGGQPKKVFTYYWKIPNANFLLTGRIQLDPFISYYFSFMQE